jgi:peptidyl-prolyl cis-trans isomerase SurA
MPHRIASMSALARALGSIALACGLALSPASAGATVVERIVAIVGERAILLSDLKARAEPLLIQVSQNVPEGAQRNAHISQIYRAVLDRIVDEELEERAATQAKIVITAREIDQALERVAAQNKLTVEQMLLEARRAGMAEREYREELRRQLLEAKLISVRLQGRIRITDEDLRTLYRKLELEERQKLDVRAAWIVISGAGSAKEQRALAERVAEQARVENFAELARRHSDDPQTKERGGALGPMIAPSKLPPQLGRASLNLEVGETSAALKVGGDYVILKVLERAPTSLPSFEEARRELSERVYMDKMGTARRSWLDALRRQHHVDIRL